MKEISLNTQNKEKIPKNLQTDDNRYSDSFVKYFLERYTKKGDKVIDPFAGLGTTLFIAEEMNRIPFGIEIDKKRYEFIKNRIINKENIILGDSLKILGYNLPKFDFSITSPPYNPIDEENYLSGKGGYKGFIKDIGRIYFQLKELMKKDAYIVIEVSNLKGKSITPLSFDIKKELSKIFHFKEEIIINWKGKTKIINSLEENQSRALIFRK